MPNTIEENANLVLRTLAEYPREQDQDMWLTGGEIAERTQLGPGQINDAVTILVEAGLVEWLRTLATAPYNFRDVVITPRGRYEHERSLNQPPQPGFSEVPIVRPPSPIGSPFGFTDQDWETASERKGNINAVYVVFGYQFSSSYYDSDRLRENVRSMFERAVNDYNGQPGSQSVILDFRPLAAGYGEHLFNEISRDIISSDIAVFETSDLNPNVMLELGVALTWGVRVLPIKLAGCPTPPSDISGQTWADYEESASRFLDTDHAAKLVRMVDRAVRKKGHA